MIEAAKYADLQALMALEADAFPEHGRDNPLRWLSNLPTCRLIRGEHQLVGAYVIRGRQLDLLLVHPYFQQQGYGRVLLNDAIERGVCHLWVQISNTQAVRLYTSAGFIPTGKVTGIRAFQEMRLRRCLSSPELHR